LLREILLKNSQKKALNKQFQPPFKAFFVFLFYFTKYNFETSTAVFIIRNYDVSVVLGYDTLHRKFQA